MFWTRRRFIASSLAGMAALAIVPGMTSCNSEKKSGDIRLGFIGMGRQSISLMNGFLQIPGVVVVAGCDVYGVKRQRFEIKIKTFYEEQGKKVKVQTYEKYQDLLARKDIDAVVIATPDHSHAMIAIAACKAGKDIYLEKPLSFTIKEGQELVKAVRENNIVMAIGSQQRSDPNFQHVVKLVQSGELGKISLMNAYVGAPPIPYNLAEEPLPADLNWDLWLGPLTADIHFNNELNPPISIDPPENEKAWGAWRWYKEMGGGFTTDWGAHMFDIGQWALGMDGNGPVEISPIADGAEYMSFKYANGTVMTSEPWDEKKSKGVKFRGEKGWVEITRTSYNASDPKFYPPVVEKTEGEYETKIPHQLNFIESIKSRMDPIVPVEIGHSSCTVCTLGNIACELKRTIKWDPSTQTFVDDIDGAATKMLHYEYRNGYNLV